MEPVVSRGDALGLCSQTSSPPKRRAVRGCLLQAERAGSSCGTLDFLLHAKIRHALAIYCSPLRAAPPFVTVEVEPNSSPSSRNHEVVALGRMGKGPAAAMVAPSNFVRSNHRGSGLSSALFQCAGSPPSLMPSSMGDLPRFDASSSSPVGRGGFPGSPSSSPAWWNAAADGGSPIAWDPTRFMGILSSQDNLHFVGSPSHYAPLKTPRSANVGGSFASVDASSPPDVEILLNKQPAVVDASSPPDVRTEKWINWTPQEDEKLMSAWIENSTNSTTGADREGETYWGNVIKAYNKNTPPQRKRNAKQAKDRWHKINKWCDLFEGDYLKARRVFTSGYSDDMWMDAAEKFYLDHKLGTFVIKNVWKSCREVAKCKTYNEELKNARKRKSYHLEEDVENVDSEDEMPKRPMGQKAAKKAALAAKVKSKAMSMENQRNMQFMWKSLIN